MQQLQVAPRQLHGVYRYRQYRTLVESAASLTTDARRVKKLLGEMDQPLRAAPRTATGALVQASAESVAADVAALVGNPVDTLDVLFWLRLRDALIGATRLLRAPYLDCGLGLSVCELITSVAQVLDVAMRIVDANRMGSDVGSDVGSTRAAAPLIVDICCYRGCAWLALIDDMGTLACALADDSWLPRRDAYAMGIVQAEEARVREFTGKSGEAAQRAWLEATIEIACDYDHDQFAYMRQSLGRVQVELDPDDVAAALDASELMDVRDALVTPPVAMDCLRGFCRTFTVRPLGCVANVPVAFEERATDAVESRRLERLIAQIERKSSVR